MRALRAEPGMGSSMRGMGRAMPKMGEASAAHGGGTRESL